MKPNLYLLLLFLLLGCRESSTLLALKKTTLDPFVIPTVRPLTLPPEYSRRPEATEEFLSQERETLTEADSFSPGERALLEKIGDPDPNIRLLIQEESGNVIPLEPDLFDALLSQPHPSPDPLPPEELETTPYIMKTTP